uniref:Uncharacterized protein n=1 Tax=Solanum lycopersicum TaxID=4081 RepID=A0A3Q7HK16_SOLLC
MTEEKDVKVHINEIYKLVEDLKSEKIILLKQFVAGILIQKLSKSWNDYKQNLKDKQKLLSLEDLVKHVIIKDINRQQSYFVKAKEIATKVNLVEDNHNKHNKYEKELDYKLRVNNQNFKKKKEGQKDHFVRGHHCLSHHIIGALEPIIDVSLSDASIVVWNMNPARSYISSYIAALRTPNYYSSVSALDSAVVSYLSTSLIIPTRGIYELARTYTLGSSGTSTF